MHIFKFPAVSRHCFENVYLHFTAGRLHDYIYVYRFNVYECKRTEENNDGENTKLKLYSA